ASTTTPGVLGHGETGATIRFYATADCTGSVIGQGVVVAAGGAFELTVGVGGDTVTAIRATATDAAGNVSTCSAPLSYTNDNTAPAKPVWVGSTPASPNRTSTTPTLTGTTDPGVSVRIYKGSGCGGAALATVTSDGSGQFTYAATVSANSTTRFYAVAVDQVGNASACSDALTYVHDSQGPPKPTITSSVPTSPGQDATPDLLGSAESQATVKVYRTSDCTGTVVGTDTADGAMSWRTNGVAVGANNGATQFYASATDAVGNVSPCSDAFTYVHDDIAPARPIVVDTDPVGPANEQNPAVRGTAEAGSTVQIYANATCTGAARGAGTASGSGAFSIASLADQNTTTTFYARATDAAGNVSPCSTTFASYVHDGSAPNRPVMIRTEPDRWSSTVHAPLVVGTAEPLSTVRVYLTQGCSGAFQTTTAAANGEFSLVDDIGTNDKEVKFAAKAVDSSGNVSPCSQNNLPYRYDKTPPTFAGAAGMVLGANTTSSARVSWTAASDNFTTAANMVYLVCLSERCGAVDCDFDDPAATNISTTAAGATLYDFTGLTANTRYYVVVRARDEVGNKDANQAIVSVKTEGLNAVVGVTVGENVACATLADGSRSCWGASTIPNDIVDPVQFSISPDHGCAVRRTGQVRCWGGENGHGEHGSGATGYSGSGSVAVLTLTNAVKVGAGQEHTCALTADGAVYCWGRDDRGQVGNGSSSAANQLAPVPVMTDFNGTTPLTGAIDIAVGESFACALRIDGAVWCWGEGVYGQLGTGQQQNVTFAQQGQATNALSIVAGKRHTCALNAAGRVSCWGSNDYGQVGIGLAQSVVTTPQDVGLADVLALGTGALHVCAVRANGQASCWGRNDHAQIGTGTASENVPTPTPVAGLSALSAIAAGDGFTCARRADGTAWCWGSGEGGRLGQGTSQADSATPVQAVLPLGVAAVTDLSIDHEHACVSLSDGTARCWGRATDGQLGDGESGEDRLPLVVVSGLGGVLDVATGGRHSCARTATGAPYCWGANDRGQLGAGTGASAVPRPVSTLTAVRQLALGYEHTCALKADGTVACWGDNGLGQVGTAAGGTKTTPTAVPGLTQVTSIAAGKNHACASTTAGTVYCWGANGAGQVNAGTGTPSGPTQVPGITTARAVSAGGAHSCALLVDGTARCWGQNTSGQIGGGSVGGNLGVTTVTGLSGVRTIAAGDRHTCAVRFTGVISCWGDNTAGSVGTGAAQTTYGTATALTGLPAARGVSAGEDNTCAPTSTGLAYCWGDNDAGALGTSAPSTTDSRVPVLVECLP
ncbi:MAG: hypothetical protein KC635_10575, partial [Myxococcales bacterium]|nr:hypothetical protein [Myxococcales bacterium]